MKQWAVLIALLALASPLAAQDPMEARALEMTRPQLEAVLARYEEAVSSPGYSRELREQARHESELIRRRLEEGDFQVGDRIVVRIRGPKLLADTLVVQPGRTVEVQDVGTISLVGVLRSELTEHMKTELSRYIRDPEVEAQALVRVAVMGEVNKPGFMVLPASMLLEDALMAAGGPSRDADLDRMEVRRGDDVIWSGGMLQQALVQGRTLDQLNLRAGDRIEVPKDRPGFFSGLRAALFVIPPLVLIATRIF